VQNLIVDLLRSSEGLCEACCGERTLELATARCQACVQNVCDSCAAEHVNSKHELRSLVEVKCEKHPKQKLELFCYGCQTNICVICFSERHQSHNCDAIETLADKITQQVKVNVDELGSRERCLRTALDVVVSRKRKYERQVCALFVICGFSHQFLSSL